MQEKKEGYLLWTDVKDEMVKKYDIKNNIVDTSYYMKYNIKNNFKMFAFTSSKYKFAMKLLADKKSLLEIGCSEGFFIRMFLDSKEKIVGIDFDEEEISFANSNIRSDNIRFICCDFLEYRTNEIFESVISFDVIEHIMPDKEDIFMENICSLLDADGIAIIGTPNLDAAVKHQSELSAKWHVNLYSFERLLKLGDKYFHNAFLFSSNDEMIHTGFYPMAHYFILIGISPIK